MKVTVHQIVAKQDNLEEMDEFLRQIPNGEQFRSNLVPGRKYRDKGLYSLSAMTGYYLQSDGARACCFIVTNLYWRQHEAVIAFLDSWHSKGTTLGLEEGFELALKLKLEPDPTDEEIDKAIKLIEKNLE